jgi:hypothetical protein
MPPGTESNPAQESKSSETWHFAVSGDSRNCGDVVMPTIANNVHADRATFYWHLGDYRAIYDFDQDIKARNPTINVITYESSAWKDFIDRQLKPFGDLLVYRLGEPKRNNKQHYPAASAQTESSSRCTRGFHNSSALNSDLVYQLRGLTILGSSTTIRYRRLACLN